MGRETKARPPHQFDCFAIKLPPLHGGESEPRSELSRQQLCLGIPSGMLNETCSKSALPTFYRERSEPPDEVWERVGVRGCEA